MMVDDTHSVLKMTWIPESVLTIPLI